MNADRSVEETGELHLVLQNNELQYSIWPADFGIPSGWHQIGEPGSTARCLDAVRDLWTDMRPASTRAGQAAPSPVGRPGNLPTGWLQQSVADLIQVQATRAPDRSAVISDEGSLTYARLDELASRLALWLKKRGITSESVVPVCLDRGIHLIVALLAVLKAGGAFLPLDPTTPRPRLVHLIGDVDAEVILSSADRAGLFAGGPAEVVDVPGLPADVPPDSLPWPAAGPHPDSLAYVIYTSGSTGPPKGVMITNRSLVHSLTAVAARYGLAPGDRVLHLAALGFDTSIEQVFATLISGATLVVPDRHGWAPTDLLSHLPELGITVADLTPSYWREFLGVVSPGDSAVSSLRLIIVGGEIVHTEHCRRSLRTIPGARLVNAYGLTETAITSTLCDIGEELLAVHDSRPAPVGEALEGVRVYVVDHGLRPVPPGERGEVCIGGAVLARGIWKEPGLTASQFLPDPYGPEPGARMYRTGDVGRWRSDGKLEILGRADNQVKIHGFRVDPAEVEAALVAHPGIRQAVVTAHERRTGRRELVAYYTTIDTPRTRDTEAFGEELRSVLAERLPGYMVPRTFKTVEDMPFLPSGKIDRGALPRLGAARHRNAGSAVPAGPARMSELWRQILGVEHVYPQDDFFELGGNSLLAMEMLARTRIVFGIGVEQIRALTMSFLRDSTLAGFAECARRARVGVTGSGDLGGVDFDSESELRVSVGRSAPRVPNRPHPTDVLLTGATGFCGAHLIDELLESTTARIHCLVRASDRTQAWERIRSAYQHYVLRDLAPSRVNPVVGDLALPNLGLPPETFEVLGRSIDAIYHFGGQVNFIYPYHDLRSVNVEGTREIIRLAAPCAVPIHYASSMAVLAGFGPAGVREVTEETPLDFADYLSVGYVEGKWVCEALLKKAAEAGLPVAVYRLNDVTGSSRTGVMNTATEMCALIRYIADSGSCPDVDLPLDFLPADSFARAVRHISAHGLAQGTVYHLTNPQPTVVDTLAGCLLRRGYAVERTPYSEWVAGLIQYAVGHPTHPMTPFVPLFVDRCRRADLTVSEMYLKSVFPTFTRWNVEQALQGSGIEVPPVDAKLLDRYLDFLELSGYLPSGRG